MELGSVIMVVAGIFGLFCGIVIANDDDKSDHFTTGSGRMPKTSSQGNNKAWGIGIVLLSLFAIYSGLAPYL